MPQVACSLIFKQSPISFSISTLIFPSIHQYCICNCLQSEMVISINMILMPLVFTERITWQPCWRKHPTSYPGYLL